MASYLKPDILARAEALGLKARTLVEGLRVGEHKSPYHGFSVEFSQHREYVPGDDTRHIDWRVYGRQERYVIKQYEQETNFIGHILLDASNSMLYGEGDQNKLEYAKHLAATLAYLIIMKRDSAGLYIFDDTWRFQLPPRSHPGHVNEILKALESAEPRDKTSMAGLIHELAGRIRRRGLVFLISDCFDEVPSLMDSIQHLRFQGHEVVLFHVLHPEETDFPFEGMTRFEGLEMEHHLLTRPNLIRPSYIRNLQAYLGQMREGCEAARCDYVPMVTSRPLGEALTEYLARRMKIRRI